jgi:hypothetical protein
VDGDLHQQAGIMEIVTLYVKVAFDTTTMNNEMETLTYSCLTLRPILGDDGDLGSASDSREVSHKTR